MAGRWPQPVGAIPAGSHPLTSETCRDSPLIIALHRKAGCEELLAVS